MKAKFFDQEKNEVELDVNENSILTLQGIENSMVMVAMEKIIQLLEQCPIIERVLERLENDGDIFIKRDREFVEDYFDVYKTLCTAFCGFYAPLKFKTENIELTTPHDMYLAENIKYCDQVAELLEASGEYLQLLYKLEQITYSEQTKENFLKIVTKYHKKMDTSLNKILNIVKRDDIGLVGDVELYEVLQNMIALVTDKMDIKNLKKEIKDNKTVCSEKKNPTDNEKTNLINKANNLFMQLRLDFMRDLEQQVPYSARDKYEFFMNKYEKFIKSFSMPLSNDTSIGMAKEACVQIQNLMDYVSYISSESYSTILPAEDNVSSPSIFFRG